MKRQYDALHTRLMAAVRDVLAGVEMASMEQREYASSVARHEYIWKNELFMVRRVVLAKTAEEKQKFQALLFGSIVKWVEAVVVDGTVAETAVGRDVDVHGKDADVDPLVDDMKATHI